MKPEQGVLIGIDLGGTNVRAGALTQDGQLLYWQDSPIEAARGPEIGLQTIINLTYKVATQVGLPISALGIGSTGPLDRQRGCIQNPYTLPGWENVDIVNPLHEKFDVPVTLENDADAAALGESWAGSGRGVKRMYMVTIGTGVGTSLILDGHIYRGLNDEHPEGGHIVIDPSGPECYCGARGCWESLVSGPAITRFARESEKVNTSAFLRNIPGGLEKIDTAAVFDGARAGDTFCQEIVDRTAEYIAIGLINLMMLNLPDCIVLTGGVLRSYDLIEERIRSLIARHDVIIPATKIKLQTAKLGQQAGMVGAARAVQLVLLEALK